METLSVRAHKQTTAQATIQEVLHKPMFRARFVTCSRTHQGMDTDGLERVTDDLEELGFSQKKDTKETNQQDVCPGEESTDDLQSDNSTTGPSQTAMGLQTVPETGYSCQVHLARL